MTLEIYAKLIAQRLEMPRHIIVNTLKLIDNGCTIPFMARYRKEATDSMDEVQLTLVSNEYQRLKDLTKRRETILKTIDEQGKLTEELLQRIEQCWNSTELEDIYLPYKPKRRTRAQVAREQGLQPLADILLQQRESNPLLLAEKFIGEKVETAELALKGAQDIIAETISENERTRQLLRNIFRREAYIVSKAVKNKQDSDEAAKFSDYFDVNEPLRRCSGNRILAMRRGEAAGFLRVSITVDDDEAIARIKPHYVRGKGACSRLVAEAVEDAYKRLLVPSIENEFATLSKDRADDEAIDVFVKNLRQLLMAPLLGQKRVMGIDPGFRTGCKVVCLDQQGNLVHHDVIYPHPPQRFRGQATYIIEQLIEDYSIEAIAIGNGTASRETREFIESTVDCQRVQVYVVSEDGASIYSASEIARREFPDEDVTVRGAVSIARRLMDPLAELVKIDARNLGVGQYQHDVDQTKLKQSLDRTVEFCVNTVGVNVNTASESLLTYVSGLGPALAHNVVEYRRENGPFKNRNDLKKVTRLGANAFTQCAGFLRIPDGTNPLDNSAVHPESYGIVEKMAKDKGCRVADLMTDKDLRRDIRLQNYVTDTVGMPTLKDIMSELEKPGRDPRTQLEAFNFDERVHEIEDLQVGMILPGIVTNITKFGVFVDVGVHQDGLVHVSQLANRFIKDPTEVVSLHEHVRVKVIEVDLRRNRISLSIKQAKESV